MLFAAWNQNQVLKILKDGMRFLLQSNDGEERLAVVRLLAKLFGAKDSELASQNRPLWQCFLGRWAISALTIY